MVYRFFIFAFSVLIVTACSFSRDNIKSENVLAGSFVKLEMHLSAFGVESDDFPSVDAYIDFRNDSSICKKSFYNPAYNSSYYSLSEAEIQKILKILMSSDLEKLKKEYTVLKTDQPNSTTTIYTTNKKFTIIDYGLAGEYPLQELYKRVYKL